MGEEKKSKSGLVSTILTVLFVLGIAGAFVYKFFIAAPTDPVKKAQMDPEGALQNYLKTTYEYMHDTATLFDIQKLVPKEDYEWFQANYNSHYEDPISLGTSINPSDADAVARKTVMRDIIEASIWASSCIVDNKAVQDTMAELDVHYDATTQYRQGYVRAKVQLVREGKYWKVKDFAGGRAALEGNRDASRWAFVPGPMPGSAGGAAEAGAATGAAAGAMPGTDPGVPAGDAAGLAAGAGQGAAGAPVAGMPGLSSVDLELAKEGIAVPNPAGAAAAPVAAGNPQAFGNQPPAAAPGYAASAPPSSAPAGNLADYMKQIGAQPGTAPAASAPATSQAVPPAGYQPGYAPGAGAPAAVQQPAAPGTTAGTVEDADRLIQQARDDWSAGRKADSVARAEQALALYRRLLGDANAKTVQAQQMLTAARQQAGQ